LSTISLLRFIKDSNLCTFSEFKVINRFKVKERNNSREKYKNEQHGRSHKRYSIILDAKYVKMIIKRTYRRENVFDIFRSFFQNPKRDLFGT
jgi:hypothetical protein